MVPHEKLLQNVRIPDLGEFEALTAEFRISAVRVRARTWFQKVRSLAIIGTVLM